MAKRKRVRRLLPLRNAGARSGVTSAEDNPSLQAIWDAVAQIPRGRASTYGDVARAAGLPGRARLAGYALKHLPPGLELPWHRVVGAGGKIVFPPGSRAFREQTLRLRGENVKVENGRVARSALLEGPPGD